MSLPPRSYRTAQYRARRTFIAAWLFLVVVVSFAFWRADRQRDQLIDALCATQPHTELARYGIDCPEGG